MDYKLYKITNSQGQITHSFDIREEAEEFIDGLCDGPALDEEGHNYITYEEQLIFDRELDELREEMKQKNITGI